MPISTVKRIPSLHGKSNYQSTLIGEIYQILFRPQLEYVSPTQSPWLGSDILELDKVQHCAARFGYNLTQMISTLDWETLEPCHCMACLDMLIKAHQQCYQISNESLQTLYRQPYLPDPFLLYQEFFYYYEKNLAVIFLQN